MKTLAKIGAIAGAAAIVAAGLAGCSDASEASCTDPLGSALAELSSEGTDNAQTSSSDGASSSDGDGGDVGDGAGASSGNGADTAASAANSPQQEANHSSKAASANAQELTVCVTEAMGKLKGYQQETISQGFTQTSRVNVNPLKADMQLDPALDNGLSQVIMIEGFVFAKVDGEWIEATEDNPDPIIKDLLNLPKSFQTQFNPNLRSAGTDDSIIYSVTGTDTILDEPVLVLEAPIASEQGTYISRYYLDAKYRLLRSETLTESGEVTSTSTITQLDATQSITNPMLPEK